MLTRVPQSPSALLQAAQSLTSLQRLRIVDNSDWEGGKFDVEDARRVQQAVPTLASLDVISMAHTSVRTFVRHDVEIQGGRTVLFKYKWIERIERSRNSYYGRT